MKAKLTSIFRIGKSGNGRNSLGNIYVDTDDIVYIGEIINNRNKLIKGQCKIIVKDVGEFIIRDTFDNVSKLQNHKTIVGFR